MTLTPAQEQAMWRFMREFAQYWSSSDADARYGHLESGKAAARALLEVSEPPKGRIVSGSIDGPSCTVRGEASAPAPGRSVEQILELMCGYELKADRVSYADQARTALRLYREQQNTHKRTLEAMGAKNDRLEERIGKAYNESLDGHSMYSYAGAIRGILGAGEDK